MIKKVFFVSLGIIGLATVAAVIYVIMTAPDEYLVGVGDDRS